MQPLNLKNIDSSYRENNYGEVFYYITKSFQPRLVVELGSYQGYSALHIVKALSEQNYNSKFISIDLYNKYLYTHSTKEILMRNFDKNKLSDLFNVELEFTQYDAYKYADKLEDNSIDLLHIDLSNTGDILEKCFEKWHKKIKMFGIVIFEGGSEERDYAEWMIKYRKTSLLNFIDSCFFQKKYEHITLKPKPSLTIAEKVRK